MSGRSLASLGLKGLVVGALLGWASVSNAEVVADLGTLSIGQAETTGCNTSTCTASTGSAGGSLPVSGAFSHQIVFTVASESIAISSAQALNRAFFDIADVTYQLFEQTGGSIALGGTATGILLATAAFQDFGLSRAYLLSFGNLDPAKTYFLQFAGADGGVTDPGASYTTQVSVSAVPLPPAVFLLLAALAGLVGFARVKMNRASA